MSTGDNYRNLILQLLPNGKAWNKDEGSILWELADGSAQEIGRLSDIANAFFDHVDPRTSTDLLDDWESLLEIPDECQVVATNISDRRRDIIRKLTNRGGSSLEFFITLAQRIGYTVTVNNCFPALAGRAKCGDAIFGSLWSFYFQVKTPQFDLRDALAGTALCGDPLRTFNNGVLECVVKRSKPANTNVQFLYGS